ncbi:MAG: cyclase family protein [Methanothrix sp.]|nr:cyclase family protein [Methanothrix sp.]HQI67871.1 cyclase family protein [Methanothrix sp.]HRS84361.1 cyclase family protein [Methanothrix sp.]
MSPFKLPSCSAPDFYDISVPLCSAPSWPGDRPFSLEWQSGHLDEKDGPGNGCLLSALSLSSHAATHLDFPCHVLSGGRRQDDYSVQRFILPAWVVDARGEEGAVSASALREGLPGGRAPPGEAILFKTANSAMRLTSRTSFTADYVSLSQEAARICAAAKAGLVGIDCLSVDGYESALPVHRILLNSDVLILEGIDLSAVPAGRYTLICLPLSLGGAEASPVRAVLVRQLPPR